MKVPWLSKKTIAAKASTLINRFQDAVRYPVAPPIPVEDIIERYLQLTLSYDDLTKILGMQDVLGATYVKSRLISINERLFEDGSEARLVFTGAHEIGHWVLHRRYVGSAGRTDPKGELIVCRARDAKQPIEWQADYFAACLIMPEKSVRAAFQKVCGSRALVLSSSKNTIGKSQRHLEPGVDRWPHIAAAVCDAGHFTNVSKQAMIIRLQDLGLLINLTTEPLAWQTRCA